MDNFRISTEIAVQKIWFDAAKSDASKEVEDANGASAKCSCSRLGQVRISILVIRNSTGSSPTGMGRIGDRRKVNTVLKP